MTLLSWNCRGLGMPSAVRSLRDVVRASRPQIVALLETKSNKRKCEALRVQLGFQHCFCVPANGKSGGLALMWHSEIEVCISNYSFYHIDFSVKADKVFRATLFYGCPRTHLRHHSWDLLRKLKHMSELPWCVFGDFNEILKGSESTSTCIYRRSHMEKFQEILNSCQLFDLGFNGSKYTYSNRRRGKDEVKCRLDRVVADDVWKNLFPWASVHHLVAHHSDHCPILLKWDMVRQSGNKLFRFETMWQRDPNFKHIVADSWNSQSGNFVDKLEGLKTRISEWNRKTFGNVNTQLKNLKVDLERIRTLPRTNEVIEEENHIVSQIDEWLIREEQMWHQRSRILWLTDGDNNTKYFHTKASSRRKTNRIMHLTNSEGVLCEDQRDIHRIAKEYFENIFTSKLTLTDTELESELSHVPRQVTPSQNALLIQPYSEREVTEALFQLSPSKAPGLDGFHAGFYQKNWSILKHDIISSCLAALNDGTILPHVNDSLIVLLPKQKNATKIEEYRPISLTTVTAKTIAKAIVNRLQQILPEIISPQQTAFVKGRLITDNFLIAHESAHFIKNTRRGSQVFGSLKLDMSKAYDRVEWRFLRFILLQIGFDITWVSKIMNYVSSVVYRLRINDTVTAPFSPHRGLRQGDPLSPYLFIICTEWFSSKLSSLHMSGRLSGIRVARRAPFVTHLFFADDCLLLFKVGNNTITSIQQLLKMYEKVSGQMINFQKSEIVLSPNAPTALKDEFVDLLSVKVVNSHEKYLGLPLVLKRKLTLNYTGILDKFWSKTQGWSAKQLSIGGREVLIKSVLEAIPLYYMNCFLLPESVLKKLQSYLSKFWWGGFDKHHPVYWVKNSVLLDSKENGGMGFKSLKCVNLAFLAKQCWRIIQQPDLLLSKIFKARYFHDSDFWNARVGYKPSSSWRSLLKARDLLNAGSLFNANGSVSWSQSSSGSLDIKSAYNVAKALYFSKGVYEAECSDQILLKTFWKTLWKLPIPRKVKIFGWRMYHDALPSGQCLFKRGLFESVQCCICGLGMESAAHALVGCWWARSVLQSLNPIQSLDILLNCHHPADIIFHCWKHCSIKDFSLCLIAFWYIWYNRNRVKHGESSLESVMAVHRINSLANQYLYYNSNFPSAMGAFPFSDFEWIKPPNTCIKINCDAAWNSSTRKGGVCAVARDNTGTVIAIRAIPIDFCQSSLDCEGLALLEALKLGVGLSHEHIIIESDCASAVHQLNIKVDDKTRQEVWYKDCISLLDDHTNWRLFAIRREANQVADQLAKLALHNGWHWTMLDRCPNLAFLSKLL